MIFHSIILLSSTMYLVLLILDIPSRCLISFFLELPTSSVFIVFLQRGILIGFLHLGATKTMNFN